MPMNRIAKHLAAGVCLVGLGVASATACVHDDSTLFIRNALSPPNVMLGMGCIYTADPTQTFISGGTLDVDFRSTYDAEFLVGNQMVDQGDPTKPATETSRITLKGAIVRITDTSGNKIKEFSEALSGTVDPLSGNNPSFIPVGVELVDSATAQGLLGQIGGSSRAVVELDTYTRVFGNTLGGQYVESGEFEFPVNVCKGCLILFSTTSTNPNFPTPNCLGNGASGATTNASVPCNLEDRLIDCSACAGSTDPAVANDCNPHAGAAPLDAGAG
jgi:hypothetical protein